MNVVLLRRFARPVWPGSSVVKVFVLGAAILLPVGDAMAERTVSLRPGVFAHLHLVTASSKRGAVKLILDVRGRSTLVDTFPRPLGHTIDVLRPAAGGIYVAYRRGPSPDECDVYRLVGESLRAIWGEAATHGIYIRNAHSRHPRIVIGLPDHAFSRHAQACAEEYEIAGDSVRRVALHWFEGHRWHRCPVQVP